jgi:hypothetical protein
MWSGLIYLRISSSGGDYEHINEPLDSAEEGEYYEMKVCYLLHVFNWLIIVRLISKTNLNEIGHEAVDWIYLAQDMK